MRHQLTVMHRVPKLGPSALRFANHVGLSPRLHSLKLTAALSATKPVRAGAYRPAVAKSLALNGNTSQPSRRLVKDTRGRRWWRPSPVTAFPAWPAFRP